MFRRHRYMFFIRNTFMCNTVWDLIENNNSLRYQKELKKCNSRNFLVKSLIPIKSPPLNFFEWTMCPIEPSDTIVDSFWLIKFLRTFFECPIDTPVSKMLWLQPCIWIIPTTLSLKNHDAQLPFMIFQKPHSTSLHPL